MELENILNRLHLIVKNHSGSLEKSFNFTDEPKFYQYYCYSTNFNVESSALDSNEKISKIKSLSEYLERYCLQNPDKKFVKGRYVNLKNNAINPSEFLNLTMDGFEKYKEEYSLKLENSVFRWVKCKNELNNKEVLIPAQLIYLTSFQDEILIRPGISTGAAAHEDFQNAIYNGIMENLERDSYMIRYLSKDKLPRIELGGRLHEMEKYFNRYFLELNLFETTTDLEIPSFMCLNIDRTSLGPAVSVGLKSDLNPEKAILGAIMESQQVRQWIRYLYYKNREPKINTREDIRKIEDRGFFWYSKDKIKSLHYLIKNPKTKKINQIETLIKTKKELIPFLKEKGIDTYSIDITPKEVKEAGFSVVKVIQPQLHPLFLDENFPFFYSQRLNNNLNGRTINNFPHPFM